MLTSAWSVINEDELLRHWYVGMEKNHVPILGEVYGKIWEKSQESQSNQSSIGLIIVHRCIDTETNGVFERRSRLSVSS